MAEGSAPCVNGEPLSGLTHHSPPRASDDSPTPHTGDGSDCNSDPSQPTTENDGFAQSPENNSDPSQPTTENDGSDQSPENNSDPSQPTTENDGSDQSPENSSDPSLPTTENVGSDQSPENSSDPSLPTTENDGSDQSPENSSDPSLPTTENDGSGDGVAAAAAGRTEAGRVVVAESGEDRLDQMTCQSCGVSLPCSWLSLHLHWAAGSHYLASLLLQCGLLLASRRTGATAVTTATSMTTTTTTITTTTTTITTTTSSVTSLPAAAGGRRSGEGRRRAWDATMGVRTVDSVVLVDSRPQQHALDPHVTLRHHVTLWRHVTPAAGPHTAGQAGLHTRPHHLARLVQLVAARPRLLLLLDCRHVACTPCFLRTYPVCPVCLRRVRVSFHLSRERVTGTQN